MHRRRSRVWIGFGLACLTGCSTVQTALTGSADDRPDVPNRASILAEKELDEVLLAPPSRNTRYLTGKKARLVSLKPRTPAAVVATHENDIPAL
ncbi:MAG TPA: hypothetical protein DCM07_08825, partial [Planctomycetaceae bacterium]|nr:hypothetical protein [Planctomycetaceae bacterium]